MALIRRRWFQVTALGLVAVTLAILPPRLPGGTEKYLSYRVGRSWQYWEFKKDQGAFFFQTLDFTRRELTNRIEARQRSDSIVRLANGAGAHRSRDGRIVVVDGGRLRADSVRAWLEALEGEMSVYRAPRSAVGMPVVVALEPGNPKHFDGYMIVRRNLAAAGADSVCMVEVNIDKLGRTRSAFIRHDASGHYRADILDRCALYGLYGRPGPGLRRLFGEPPDRSYYDDRSGLATQVLMGRRSRVVRSIEGRTTVAVLAGLNMHLWAWQNLLASRLYNVLGYPVLACVQGTVEACNVSTGLTGTTSPTFWWNQLVSRDDLLARLLAMDKENEFETAWRSPLGATVAIEGAYGRATGPITRDMALERLAPDASGPAPSAGVLLASTSWMVVAVGVSMFLLRRRQVRS